MTSIYQGGGITEYHLNSGQILVLNEQEMEELIDLDGDSLEDVESNHHDYEECKELLEEVKIEDDPASFLYDVIGNLKLFKKDGENLPSIDDVLLQLDEANDLLVDDIRKRDELIDYLQEWVKDENVEVPEYIGREV